MSKLIQINIRQRVGHKFSNLDSAIPLEAFAKSSVFYGNINKFVQYFHQLNKKNLKKTMLFQLLHNFLVFLNK